MKFISYTISKQFYYFFLEKNPIPIFWSSVKAIQQKFMMGLNT